MFEFLQPLKTEPLPFEYKVRISSRARHVRIKISHWGEVEVVTPKGVSQKKVSAFIHEQRAWVIESLSRLKQQHHQNLDTTLPTMVALAALDSRWQIRYEQRPAQGNLTPSSRITETDQSLLITTSSEGNPREQLRKWLHEKAKITLSPLLLEVSTALALPYGKLTIRGQKSRWGSCSQRKNINLNRNLLFLPRSLVRYLLVHELCHTVHLNHSREYWALVKSIEPNYRELERALNHGWRYVPLWAYATS